MCNDNGNYEIMKLRDNEVKQLKSPCIVMEEAGS